MFEKFNYFQGFFKLRKMTNFEHVAIEKYLAMQLILTKILNTL